MKGNGYPLERYNVTTDDCYILQIHRMPFGRKSPDPNVPRPVVFLQHGLFCSSADWVYLPPDQSLGDTIDLFNGPSPASFCYLGSFKQTIQFLLVRYYFSVLGTSHVRHQKPDLTKRPTINFYFLKCLLDSRADA